MFHFGFNKDKLKPNLKMAVHRLQIAANKKTNQIKNQKKEIATLLNEKPPKEEKARIRAEALIREDFTIEAYEIIELQCELLHERMRLIESQQACPPDLISCVQTLMWSSIRVDVPELMEVKKQLTLKYKTPFAEQAMSNGGGHVNDRVLHKLSVQPPSAFLVLSYLREIATQYGVDYNPTQLEIDATNESNMQVAMAAPTGFSIPNAPGSEFSGVYNPAKEAEITIGPNTNMGNVKNLPEGWGYTQDGLLSAGAEAQQPSQGQPSFASAARQEYNQNTYVQPGQPTAQPPTYNSNQPHTMVNNELPPQGKPDDSNSKDDEE